MTISSLINTFRKVGKYWNESDASKYQRGYDYADKEIKAEKYIDPAAFKEYLDGVVMFGSIHMDAFDKGAYARIKEWSKELEAKKEG